MSKYRKFIVAAVGGAVAIALQLAADGLLGDYGPVVASVATAIGVYATKNAPADA